MKILICVPDTDLAQMLFEEVVSFAKETKLSGQVSNNSNYDHLRQQLSVNSFEYDIFLLDALDKECLNIARYIRMNNLIASIILIAIHSKQVSNILMYRPSALITRVDDNKQIINAIKWTYREQIRANPYFIVKNKEAIIRIGYTDILWFESHQRTVTLHSKKQEITFYAKLSEVYEEISHEIFLRCHQSYIVNCNMIRHIDKVQKCIYLINGEIIEISKSYYQQVIAFASRR